MKREELLEIQLRQAEQALEVTRRLREMAEEQYRLVLMLLHRIALSLVAPEWNELRRENDVSAWPPERLAVWIIETVQARLNRLEILAGGRSPEPEKDAEVQRLQEQVQRLTEQVLALERETESLRRENLALTRALNSREEKPGGESPTPVQFCSSGEWAEDNDAVEVIRVIGSTGLSTRDDIARVLGKSSRSGGISDLFQRLRGLISEEPISSEVGGRGPNIIRLTTEGQRAYMGITGQKPVESEFDRLVRRHRSPEQALLALQARQVLRDRGATEVNLFPEPIPLASGGFFMVDLTAIWEERMILVECERVSTRVPRVEKWNAYREVTSEFYFFVPTKEVLKRLLTELNLWAYQHIDRAQGVIVHVHQLSAREETLWHYTRPLAGTRKEH